MCALHRTIEPTNYEPMNQHETAEKQPPIAGGDAHNFAFGWGIPDRVYASRLGQNCSPNHAAH